MKIERMEAVTALNEALVEITKDIQPSISVQLLQKSYIALDDAASQFKIIFLKNKELLFRQN